METSKPVRHSAARELFCLHTSVQLFDNNTVIVEQCGKLLEINDLLVRLNTGRFVLAVWGQGLEVTDLKAGGVRITGEITSLELAKR